MATKVHQIEQVSKKQPKVLLYSVIVFVFDVIAAFSSVLKTDEELKFDEEPDQQEQVGYHQ